MTRSNRSLNRFLLLVTGLAALALAAALALPWTPWRSAVRYPYLTGDATALWLVAAAAVVVVVLCAAWIASRGRGRTRAALETGDTEIDAAVVASLLRARLGANPDVAAVSASAYRRRRARIVLVQVQTRPAPDLGLLTDDVHAAVAGLHRDLGAAVPVVVHLTSGLRGALSAPRVAH